MKFLSSLIFLGVCARVLPAQAQVPHHDLAHVQFCDRTQAMLDEGEADKPAHEARLWLRSHPRDPDAFIVLGQAAQLNGDWRGSLSFVQAAYAANPLYRNVSQSWADDSRRFLHRFPSVHLRRITVHRVPWAALQAKARAMLLARQYDALDAMEARLLRSRARLGSTWAATEFADVLWNSPSGDAAWRLNHARLQAWQRARPKSLLARIAVARSWTAGAFLARGEEAASKTSPAAIRVMNARLGRAAPLMRALVPHIKETPLVFGGLQAWALLAGMPRRVYFPLLGQAQEAFPTYSGFAVETATFLLPRWYGRPGEWERFATAQANRVGGARGDILYADIVGNQAFLFGEAAKETSASYARLKRGLQAAIHSGRDPLGDSTTAFVAATRWDDNAWARRLCLGPLRSQIVAGELSLPMFNSLRVDVFRAP